MRPSTFHSLHAHTLTLSAVDAVREKLRGGTRLRTAGALLRPPPPRLVAISRCMTSRVRRHNGDVINGTSHGPPAAASPPPARACANGTASTVRSFHTPAPPALQRSHTRTLPSDKQRRRLPALCRLFHQQTPISNSKFKHQL
jgi:hypothetical protein